MSVHLVNAALTRLYQKVHGIANDILSQGIGDIVIEYIFDELQYDILKAMGRAWRELYNDDYWAIVPYQLSSISFEVSAPRCDHDNIDVMIQHYRCFEKIISPAQFLDIVCRDDFGSVCRDQCVYQYGYFIAEPRSKFDELAAEIQCDFAEYLEQFTEYIAQYTERPR